MVPLFGQNPLLHQGHPAHLDHVIIFNQDLLRRILKSYLEYYHGSRTHLGLDKDAPDGWPVEPPRHVTAEFFQRELDLARKVGLEVLDQEGSLGRQTAILRK